MDAAAQGYYFWAMAIGALPGAGLVMLGTRLTCRFTPPFRVAYKGTLWVGIATSMIAAAIDFPPRLFGASLPALTTGLALIIGFSVSASIYGRMLRHPELGPIGYGRACLVSAIQFAVMSAIGVGLYIVMQNRAQEVINAALRVAG